MTAIACLVPSTAEARRLGVAGQVECPNRPVALFNGVPACHGHTSAAAQNWPRGTTPPTIRRLEGPRALALADARVRASVEASTLRAALDAFDRSPLEPDALDRLEARVAHALDRVRRAALDVRILEAS